MSASQRGWRYALALGAALLVAVAHMQRFRLFLSDDALISLRYAQRLNQGLGLTWTDGERVEGYTNLGWVLLAASLEWLGVHLLDAPRVWGTLGLLVAVLVASLDPAAPRRLSAQRALSGGLFVATSGGMAAWAMGGLEQTLLAGLVVTAAFAAARTVHAPDDRAAPWVAAGCLTLGVVLRADAAVLWIGLLAGWGACRPRWSALAPSLLLPLAALLGQTVFRVGYYGDWLPNTARAKVSGTAARAYMGLAWLGDALLHHAPLVGVALVGAAPVSSPLARIVGAPVVAWCVYLALVGGDIFEAWRQLVPIVPLLGLLAAQAAPRAPGLLAVALAAHIAINLFAPAVQRTDGTLWVRHAVVTGARLRAAVSPARPLLAVDAAGGLPFGWRLPALDMLGLTDAHLTRNPPPRFGGAGIGHDLGDGDYLWSRAPDLVIVNSGYGSDAPRWLGAQQLEAHAGFHERYQRVVFTASHEQETWTVLAWARRDGGPLGVRYATDAVYIPAHLLSSRQTPARLGATGRLPVKLREGRAASIDALALPAGRWRAELPGGVSLSAQCAGEDASGPLPAVVIASDGAAPVSLQLAVTGEPVSLDGLWLRRTYAEPAWRCARSAP